MITFVAECPGSQNIINTNPIVLQRVPVLRCVQRAFDDAGVAAYVFAYHCTPDRPVECAYSDDAVPTDNVRMVLAHNP